jgi:hypothetical protein
VTLTIEVTPPTTVTLTVSREVAVLLTPCIIAENIAAKNDGTKKWNKTLFESTTPSEFNRRFNLYDPIVHINAIENPIAVEAPGL